MGSALRKPRLSADEYLAWEQTQPERHEFLRGEVFAMAGAGDTHVTVAMNIAFALRQHLAGTPCRTYISDMRLFVEAADCYFYPDVMVSCAERDRASDTSKSAPTLVIEVLSPSTAAFDRGGKFAAYRLLPDLREYAVVDPDQRATDVYRKGDDGLWVLHPFGRDEAPAFASVGLALAPARLWADVIDG